MVGVFFVRRDGNQV